MNISFPTTTTSSTFTIKNVIVALATLAFLLWLVPMMRDAAMDQIEQIDRIEAPAPALSPAQAMRLLNPVPTVAPRLSPAQAMRLLNPVEAPAVSPVKTVRLSPAAAMRMLNPVPTAAPKRLSPAQAMRLLNPVP